MKTKVLLSATFSLLLSLTSSAAINLAALAPDDKPLSKSQATELLSTIYLHNTSLLANAEVKIFDVQTSERFTSSGTFIRTILLCSVEHKNLPTEYYAVTFSGNNIVDGALLGHNGDAKILEIKVPKDELIYKSNPEINFEFSGDTIKALRKYRFYTTARGGNWFNKDGTICNPFVVSSSGKIKQLTPTATAIRRDGDANYLSKNHKMATTTETDGEFFPLGMHVLTMAQTPISEQLDVEKLNNEAGEMMRIADQYKGIYKDKGEDPPENPETMSVMEFAKWSFNQGMRHNNDFLTWIAKNPKKEQFTRFIYAYASEDENNEIEWLKENVKNLKDKKVRKWWEKWIKENL